MILVCYGTRPEIIKLSPVIAELKKLSLPFKTLFTGQHIDLYEDVKDMIPTPDYNLGIMRHNQSLTDIMMSLSDRFPNILKENQIDLVIVQGDTSSAFIIGLICFYNMVSVGHVEAGLRTYNKYNPFPEEMNRALLSRIAMYNWAPTKIAYDALRHEGIENTLLTGNTIVDVCMNINFEIKYEEKILITLHRRENWGRNMASLFNQINELAMEYSNYRFIFPLHPNPNVRVHGSLLTASNIEATNPLRYEDFLKEISSCRFIITDSGGIQEEACCFNKKVIVCRELTERPEGVRSGMAKVVGTKLKENFDWAEKDPFWRGINPYGDGKASERIVASILSRENYEITEKYKTE